jgi:dipeptidyl-peptidase-4
MRNVYFVIVFVFLNFIIIAQNSEKKDLSLEDAVLNAGSKFRPQNIAGLKFLGNSDILIRISEDKKAILSSKVKTLKWDTLLAIDNFNKLGNSNLKTIPSIMESNDSCLILSSKGSFYRYFYKAKKVGLIFKIPEIGENHELNFKASNIAYTNKNNIELVYPDGGIDKVTDFEDQNIVAGQSIARNEFGIDKGLFWSNNGKMLAFYQKDESKVSVYPLVDITTTPASLNEIKYPMAGSANEIPRVGVYYLETQRTIYLETQEDNEDYFITNLAWDTNDKFIYLVILNRQQNKMWLNKYDVNTGKKVKTLFEESNERYIEPVFPVKFIDANTFLWFSIRDGFRHLYRYDTEGKLLNEVTKGNFQINEIISFDKYSRKVHVLATDSSGMNDELYVCDVEKFNMKKLNLPMGVHDIKLGSGGKYIVDNYSNPDTPRNISILDKKGNEINRLLTSSNPLDSIKIGKMSFVEIMAADGVTKLNGRLIKPFDFDSTKKYKVLVYVYGGPHAQMVRNSWLGNASLWMYSLSNQGYLVFTLDNRGSENRGFDFESVIHRDLGYNEMEDQLKGVEYIKTLSYADTSKMAVHGWSYGGFLTTSLMLRKPGVFKVGVAGGPVINWNWYEIMYGERYMDTPEENAEGYEKTNLLNYASNLEGNMLFVHGSVDPVVVPQHTIAMLKKFIEEGKQVDYFVYPMHEHNVFGPDRYHLMQKIINYVDEKLR